MNLVTALNVRFDAYSMWVDLSDGRVLGVPLTWFSHLAYCTEEELSRVWISSRGLHWEMLDEDISIAGLLAGLPDRSLYQSTIASPQVRRDETASGLGHPCLVGAV